MDFSPFCLFVTDNEFQFVDISRPNVQPVQISLHFVVDVFIFFVCFAAIREHEFF